MQPFLILVVLFYSGCTHTTKTTRTPISYTANKTVYLDRHHECKERVVYKDRLITTKIPKRYIRKIYIPMAIDNEKYSKLSDTDKIVYLELYNELVLKQLVKANARLRKIENWGKID